MYELTVFTCSRGDVTPVPGAIDDRVNGMSRVGPVVFSNSSSGSAGLNGMLRELGSGLSPTPGAWRRPNVWSRNCPHTKPHWVTPRSENRFWCESLKIRLLMKRGFGAATGVPMPSAYRAGATRE